MTNELRDPVCGMPVGPSSSVTEVYGGVTLHFCSDLCRQQFLQRPASYARPVVSIHANAHRLIAYFTMEAALDPRMPTYSGGLGVLAGDTLRAFADLRVPVVAVTLVHRSGYFHQTLSPEGAQSEQPATWSPDTLLQELPTTVHVEIGGRSVAVRAWQYEVVGVDGYHVPVILLDTDRPENDEPDRRLTDTLYGGDERYRLAQEIVLGVGGLRMLRALGHDQLRKIHMNEGHASLAALELLRESSPDPGAWDFASARARCVFTTHTPVPAGHDQFDYGLVDAVLGRAYPRRVLEMLGGSERFNMTRLALDLSDYVNGVARSHQQVSEHMFPGYEIHQVTNGVHSVTWTCDSFRELFDRHIPGWRSDPAMLRHALRIPQEQMWAAHRDAKRGLLDRIAKRTGRALSPDALTIGFARRVAAYKRADLIFTDLGWLRSIAARRPLQLVFAGKAHPRDEQGKAIIRRIFEVACELGDALPVIFLDEYDMDLARALISGSDVWLNTPLRPLEASGTSGMKAAHNGVPSLSTLDGWWLEGHIEGVTGWSVGGRETVTDEARSNRDDAEDLYRKLERVVAPAFYDDRPKWMSAMTHAIALNASYFNTHRMVQQYALGAYR